MSHLLNQRAAREIPQADRSSTWKPPRTVKQRRLSRKAALAAHREAGIKAPRFVYFIGAPNGLVKVGSAFDIHLRLAEVQRMSPVDLMLLAYVDGEHARRFEFAMHRHFSGDRSHGEWFHMDMERLEFAIRQALDAGWKIRFVRMEGP